MNPSQPDIVKTEQSKKGQMQALLELNQLEDFLFCSKINQVTPRGFIYGGQLLGQALIAAQATVGDRVVHSLHGNFIKGSRGDKPLYLKVEPTREGRAFSSRRVVINAGDEELFSAQLSFQQQEQGYEHQMPLDNFPPLPTEVDIQDFYKQMAAALHLQPEQTAETPMSRLQYCIPAQGTEFFNRDCTEPKGACWIKSKEPLNGDSFLHFAGLACASDIGLPNTIFYPHPTDMFDRNLVAASLNHSMWFHNPLDFNQWHLHVSDSPWSGSARGFSRGMIYNQQGKLIASTTQEMLLRPLDL